MTEPTTVGERVILLALALSAERGDQGPWNPAHVASDACPLSIAALFDLAIRNRIVVDATRGAVTEKLPSWSREARGSSGLLRTYCRGTTRPLSIAPKELPMARPSGDLPADFPTGEELPANDPVERGLENRCRVFARPRVRIPPPPLHKGNRLLSDRFVVQARRAALPANDRSGPLNAAAHWRNYGHTRSLNSRGRAPCRAAGNRSTWPLALIASRGQGHQARSSPNARAPSFQAPAQARQGR
jgi:hypothetical protein